MLTSPGMRLFDIVQVIEEAPDCFSYVLGAADGNPLPYIPGQFLTVVVEINHRPQRRAYSISAPVNDGRLFQLTIKKVDNGAVSRHVIAHWQPGMQVTALEPAGRFVLPDTIHGGEYFVFIAAGSGITPVFALLHSLIESRHPVSVLLLTQFRRENDIIFRETLKSWRDDKNVHLEWISFLSRPEGTMTNPERLNNEKLEKLLDSERWGKNAVAKYYVCGPLSFMRMVVFTLRETGVPEENIRRELFDPPREPVSGFQLNPAEHQITLKTGDALFRFTAAFPQSIMAAAAKAGIAIPFSCKAGICSTCVLRCTSGSVTMRINEVLTDADLASGLILTCVGYAGSNLNLEDV